MGSSVVNGIVVSIPGYSGGAMHGDIVHAVVVLVVVEMMMVDD